MVIDFLIPKDRIIDNKYKTSYSIFLIKCKDVRCEVN